MGAVETDDPEELKNLASRSVPAIQKYKVSTSEDVLKLDAILERLVVRTSSSISGHARDPAEQFPHGVPARLLLRVRRVQV